MLMDLSAAAIGVWLGYCILLPLVRRLRDGIFAVLCRVFRLP